MSGRGAPVGEIKNKQPAEQQITAEQVLREAKELQLEDQYTKPKQVISDHHELSEYRLRERKKFEDEVRRVGRIAFGIWVKYATFEEKQKDLRRARNVWERALHTAQHHLTFWLKYAEMEMRNGMVNHARNVWSRATKILPRIDQLWYKWIHMEEMLGQIESVFLVFSLLRALSMFLPWSLEARHNLPFCMQSPCHICETQPSDIPQIIIPHSDHNAHECLSVT